MKIRNIVVAVVAAIAAPSAMALDLTTGVSPSNIFYIAGASAQTPGLAKAMTKFCTTNLVTYVDSVDSKTAFVWKCDAANNATSGLTGSFIVVKTDAAGSFTGVGPLTNHTAVKFPNITNVTDTAIVGTGANDIKSSINNSDVVGTLKGTAEYLTGANHFAQIGLSDVSVDAWRARGNVIPTAGYTVAATFAGQGFGVIVSPLLFAKMQADQGLTGTAQPSISKIQYANLVSSSQAVWQNLLPNTATASLPTALTIARRGATSGTQAASDIYFLANPCSTGTLGGALSPVAGSATGVAYPDTSIVGHTTTVTVKEEGSTGGVKTDVGSATAYAIGVVSLENLEGTTWKFIKINGQSPNYVNGVLDATQKLNSVNGLYDFAFEAQVLTNDAETTLSPNALTLAGNIVLDQGEGSNLTTSTGLFADPQNGNFTYVVGQTAKYSRSNKECQAPQLFIY
jgi:hypothetical protein